MKNIIRITLLLCLSAVILAGCITNLEETDTENVQAQEVQQEAQQEVQQEVVEYTEYTDLTDAFMEYCKQGDVEKISSLYYGDLFEKLRSNATHLTDEQFDEAMKADMATIYSFEEYFFGCEELPPINSPLGYVNQIYHNAFGEVLPLTDQQVTDCCDLRVYKTNGAFADHMMAKIDGLWYFVV